MHRKGVLTGVTMIQIGDLKEKLTLYPGLRMILPLFLTSCTLLGRLKMNIERPIPRDKTATQKLFEIDLYLRYSRLYN